MNESASHPTSAGSERVPFFKATWRTRWIFIGLVPLLLNRLTAVFDNQWMKEIPQWALMTFGWTLALSFLVIPLVSRQPRSIRSFSMPGPREFLRELLIAIPTVIAALVLISTFEMMTRVLSPGTSMTPPIVDKLGTAPQTAVIYIYLLFACTLGPVAEEVFFRGFLHNALRARMPLMAAILLQCVLFTVGHVYTAAPLIPVLVLGLILTLLYHWRKTLLTPILVHAGINGLTAVSLFMSMAAHAETPVLGINFDQELAAVASVVEGGPAERGGVEVGDKIIAIDDQAVLGVAGLVEAVNASRPGDTVVLFILRDGEMLTLEVTLGRRGEIFTR